MADEEEAIDPRIAAFLAYHQTPERGLRLWDEWQAQMNDQGKELLDNLAQETAAEAEISLDEAKCGLSAEKLLQDRGGVYAIRFIEKRHRQAAQQALQDSRALRPMVSSSVGNKRKKR